MARSRPCLEPRKRTGAGLTRPGRRSQAPAGRGPGWPAAARRLEGCSVLILDVRQAFLDGGQGQLQVFFRVPVADVGVVEGGEEESLAD